MEADLLDAMKTPPEQEQPSAPPPKGRVLVSARIPKQTDAQIARLFRAFGILYAAQAKDASGVTPSWVIVEALVRGLPVLEKLSFGQYAPVPDSDDEKAWAEFTRVVNRAFDKR